MLRPECGVDMRRREFLGPLSGCCGLATFAYAQRQAMPVIGVSRERVC